MRVVVQMLVFEQVTSGEMMSEKVHYEWKEFIFVVLFFFYMLVVLFFFYMLLLQSLSL